MMLDEQVQVFAGAFEKELKDSFSELAEGVQFFLFIRNSQKEYPWIVGSEEYSWSGFSGTKENEVWLKYFLAVLDAENAKSDEKIDEALKKFAEKEKFIYYFCERGKNDSRIKERGLGNKKDILWLVRGKIWGEAVSAILGEVMEKTREEVSDLIFLSYYKQIPYIEERLFRAVKNKEGIRNNYTESLCKKSGGIDREFISLISARKYEKRELFSRIYLGEMPQSQMEISFEGRNSNKWKFSSGNLRFVRKVLETAKGERVLVVGREGEEQVMRGIATLGESVGNQITFNGYLKWRLTGNGKELLHYEEGKFHFSDEKQTEVIGLDALHLENEKDIKDTIYALKEQAHGTSAVFLDGKAFEDELDRLDRNNRLCRIKPVSIFKSEYGEKEKKRFRELLIGLSAIDGALIADYQGNIHAIGAILDGESVVEADMARGARYNSLKNYVNWLVGCRGYECKQCFAVIISEDGGIDVEIADTGGEKV